MRRRQADEDLGRPEPHATREEAGPYCDEPNFRPGDHVHEPPLFKARAPIDRLLATPPNPETEALSRCADSLDLLDPEACRRVLAYLTDRYTPAPTPEDTR